MPHTQPTHTTRHAVATSATPPAGHPIAAAAQPPAGITPPILGGGAFARRPQHSTAITDRSAADLAHTARAAGLVTRGGGRA